MYENLINDVFALCIREFKKEENRTAINNNIIDPLIKTILDKVYPYIIATSVIIILTFVFSAMMMFMFMKVNKD